MFLSWDILKHQSLRQIICNFYLRLVVFPLASFKCPHPTILNVGTIISIQEWYVIFSHNFSDFQTFATHMLKIPPLALNNTKNIIFIFWLFYDFIIFHKMLRYRQVFIFLKIVNFVFLFLFEIIFKIIIQKPIFFHHGVKDVGKVGWSIFWSIGVLSGDWLG